MCASSYNLIFGFLPDISDLQKEALGASHLRGKCPVASGNSPQRASSPKVAHL